MRFQGVVGDPVATLLHLRVEGGARPVATEAHELDDQRV